jgi:K+-transporting ATPase ATPase C chain
MTTGTLNEPAARVARNAPRDAAEKGRGALVKEIWRGALATLLLAIVCGTVYPLIVWSAAQLLMGNKANGSLIADKDGTVRGSRLLGQNFTGEKYFHPRPSAAGNGYDAANSSGSNLGPTSHKLRDAIKDRVDAYRKENELRDTDSVPADAVTASGSGLDPHISLHNAELQLARIGKSRGLAKGQLHELIRLNTDERGWRILGDPGVNVLMLNLALDQLKQ